MRVFSQQKVIQMYDNKEQSGIILTALKVITDASVYVAEEVGSDFGRFDGDYSSERVWYSSITIDL